MFKRKPREIRLSEVERLDVKKGDILVFRYKGILSEQGLAILRKSVEEHFKPKGIKILVLEQDMDIGLIGMDQRRDRRSKSLQP